MARLIRRDAMGPIKIEPSDKPIFVCGCGLSKKFPFCDGTHKGCAGEKPGVLYVYDRDNERVVEERVDS